ncbi:MAG: RtcB family protein [Candidatus Diapherotrites archaeon]
MPSAFQSVSDSVFEISKQGSMRVPARIFATKKLLDGIDGNAIDQLKNMATLPGIQKYAIGHGDMHSGYGFCIGGVAAFDPKENGIISPGGIGFDINCGVRLVKTNLTLKEAKPKLKELIDVLFREIPAGVGGKGKLRVEQGELREVLEEGAEWSIRKGLGVKADLQCTEEGGKMKEADADTVSSKALQRGMPQIATLGSGNHFLEIQEVREIFEPEIAKTFGLEKGQIVIMLHSGSRGFGHQVATDYLDVMLSAMQKYKIDVPDRQLACAPIESEEGKKYFSAMACAVNFAFANRQSMTHWIREGFENVFHQTAEELQMDLLYDVCHNIAKFEEHKIDGKNRKVLVHRKGATRAMPAGRKENPSLFEKTGHPALLPGSMGTASFVLVGTEKGLEESFGSVAHGAGRVMSRHGAMRQKTGEQVLKELEAKGEIIRSTSMKGLAEEMPEAYKDIEEVALSIERSGIGKKVAKMVPLAVTKG